MLHYTSVLKTIFYFDKNKFLVQNMFVNQIVRKSAAWLLYQHVLIEWLDIWENNVLQKY